jgi:hypothetical protein
MHKIYICHAYHISHITSTYYTNSMCICVKAMGVCHKIYHVCVCVCVCMYVCIYVCKKLYKSYGGMNKIYHVCHMSRISHPITLPLYVYDY